VAIRKQQLGQRRERESNMLQAAACRIFRLRIRDTNKRDAMMFFVVRDERDHLIAVGNDAAQKLGVEAPVP
jgi:hypothetical protein